MNIAFIVSDAILSSFLALHQIMFGGASVKGSKIMREYDTI